MFSQSKVSTSLRDANSASSAASSSVADQDGRDLRARRVGAAVEKQAAHAQRIAGEREHAPQLPRTDDADAR